MLSCAAIGPGGLRGVCDRRIRRGQDLLTPDEREEGEYDSDDSYRGSPGSFRVDTRQVVQVRAPGLAPTVAQVSGTPELDSSTGPTDATSDGLHAL